MRMQRDKKTYLPGRPAGGFLQVFLFPTCKIKTAHAKTKSCEAAAERNAVEEDKRVANIAEVFF